MRKKNKKKNKYKPHRFKKKKRFKNRKKKINKIKIKKRIKKLRKKKIKKNVRKLSRKTRFKVPLDKFEKIKFLKFTKQVNHIKRFNFQSIVNFMLTPIFKAYEDFREKRKIENLRKIALEKKERERQIKEEKRLRYEAKQQELRDEVRLARERSQDLKRFIRQEQAILRQEQALKRRRFLEEIKLDRKIESFRKRELKEIQDLEKIALKEQRDDYRPVEERLKKITEKYRLIREQKIAEKIRERVESLGVDIEATDTREDLLKKEKEYAEHRQNIELVLESFYRSANSLVFQLNKRYIPKHKSILRVIDRRYETNECFIRYDDSPDEDWLILIYLEDSDAKKGKIVVENKSNPEKHETKSFETKEIFAYSDYLVDNMTAHIDRERQKKTN